jgi:archaellum component FlaC
MSNAVEPKTRSELTRELAVNAATKPSNVMTSAGVAAAGLVLYGLSGSGLTLVLVPLAFVLYVVLAAMTFFDADEAQRIGDQTRTARQAQIEADTAAQAQTLDPQIRKYMDAALREEQLIDQAIADSDLSLNDLSNEVDGLVAALKTIARRAQRLRSYLDSQDEQAISGRVTELRQADDAASNDKQELIAALSDQLQTMSKMEAQLRKFEDEMEHTTTMLSTIRGQVVQMSVDADSVGEQQLTQQVRDLRSQVGAAADSMAEIAKASGA